MNPTTEQLEEAFGTLPESIRNYITSTKVAESLDKLIEEFKLPDPKAFREGVLALLVALWNADQFIRFVATTFGLPTEDAENLFGEVSDRILTEMHSIFDQALKDAGVNEVPTAAVGAGAPQSLPEEVAEPITDDDDLPVYADQTATVTAKQLKFGGGGTESWDLDDIKVVVPFRVGGFSGFIGGLLFFGVIGLISLVGIVAMNPCSLVAGLIGVAIAVFGIRWEMKGDWHLAIGFADGTSKAPKSPTKESAYRLAAAILSAKNAD